MSRPRFRTPWESAPRARHFGGGGSAPQVPIPAYTPPFTFPEMPTIEFPEMPAFPAFPAPFDPEAGEARRRRAAELAATRQIEMRRKGYASTLLTGGQGDPTDPSLQRPSLLGR